MAETQNDPLLPGYSFNAHLVAGLTPIEAEGYLDFYVDRPLGMKGYILNLTVRGEGIIKNNDQQFVCRPGDMLLFPWRDPPLRASSGCQRVVSPVGLLPPPRLLAGVAFVASHFCAHRFLPPGRRSSGPVPRAVCPDHRGRAGRWALR